MKRFFATALVLILVSGVGCGDDERPSPSGGINQCHRQCDVQAATSGCTPLVGLDDCKSLCDQLQRSTAPMCSDEFDAYYKCSADDGFSCSGSLVVQKTDACGDALTAYDKCKNGGSGSTCMGQNDSGVCPIVQCPCPEGTKSVSGVDGTGSSCKCLDEVSCKDLFCG